MKSEIHYHEVILKEEVQGANMEVNTEDNNLAFLSYEQDSHFPRHIPYVSFSQTLPIGSSEIPLDEGTVENRKERKRWKPTEDIVLINAWLNTSKDRVVSNDQQQSGAFWTRVASLYADSPSIVDTEKREPNTCKQRWRKIKIQVSKFCGAYATAKSQHKNGMNDLDDVKLAHQIFFNDHKVKFTLEHAWYVLKNHQKWCSLFATKDKGKCEVVFAQSASKGKCEIAFAQSASKDKCEIAFAQSASKGKCEVAFVQSVSSQSVNNVEDDTMVRPPGFEGSKRKRSVTNTSAVEEQTNKLENFQTMLWEIKQKDLVLKNQILDKKLLGNLLAKTGPLSDMENALKNKLIADMLSKS